jgi:pimeloyl-ACP methyl ester carboxylesterase
MSYTLVDTNSGDVEYSSIGKGIPILFLHGGHSSCHETLCHKGFDLEKYQLITPSRPGYGRTPLNGNCSPKQAADLISELLNKLSIDNLIVYGVSAGGLTAIELAANYPEKVSKLILASAVSKKWLNRDDKTYKAAQIIFNPKVEKFTWAMVRIFSKISPTMIAKSFYPEFSTYPAHKLRQEDYRELISAMNHYRSKRGFLNDIDQEINEETIKRIKCPSLVIHSKHDNSVSIEHARYSKEKIQNSRLIELDNEWGHLFWIGKESGQSIMKTLEFIKK